MVCGGSRPLGPGVKVVSWAVHSTGGRGSLTWCCSTGAGGWQGLLMWCRGRGEPGTALLMEEVGWAKHPTCQYARAGQMLHSQRGSARCSAHGGSGLCSPIWQGRPQTLLVKSSGRSSNAHSQGAPSSYV